MIYQRQQQQQVQQEQMQEILQQEVDGDAATADAGLGVRGFHFLARIRGTCSSTLKVVAVT